MQEAERYECIRNGKIGTVISRNETEVVLDFDGTEKIIKMSNLKRWYKPCSILDEQELKQAKQSADKNSQLLARVEKPDQPNGDSAPKQDCSKLANRVINYLEKNGCLTKKTQCYTRVRLPKKDRNIMELSWGKNIRNLKMVVRSEAMMVDERIFKLGTLFAINNYFALDMFFYFDNTSDIADVYRVIDLAIKYEQNFVPVPRKGRPKKGTGKVNGRKSLAYKRRILGILADDEKQQP